MNNMMTNTVAQSVCLLLLWSLVKGTELNHFSITDIECIDGNFTVSIICNVPNPQNMIIIFKNSTEITRCTTYSVEPYLHCTISRLNDLIHSSTVVNSSMTFQIDSAYTDVLIGEWVCQNGGPNDPSWSLSFPNITCPPKINLAPKLDCDDDMVEKKHDRVADIFLILAPLIGCTYFTYKAIPSGDHKVLRVLCAFVLFGYLGMSILIIVIDMHIGFTIGLTLICWLIGTLIVMKVIRKSK